MVSGGTQGNDVGALALCLQVGDPESQVGFSSVVTGDTNTRDSLPDDRVEVFVHLVASDLVIVKGKNEVAVLAKVLANVNISMEVQDGDHRGPYYLKLSVLVKPMAESEYEMCVVFWGMVSLTRKIEPLYTFTFGPTGVAEPQSICLKCWEWGWEWQPYWVQWQSVESGDP